MARTSCPRQLEKKNEIKMKNWNKLFLVIVCVVCFFNSHSQTSGWIDLIFPENEHELTLREDKVFKWATPDNWVEGQTYCCYIKIVKMNRGDNPEEAISNQAYFQDTTDETSSLKPWFVILDDLYFASGQYFAWQVKAFSADTLFAESDVNWFKGPPPFEAFKSGNRTVYTTEFTKVDPEWDSLCGYGYTKIVNHNPARTIPIYFEHIKVQRNGSYLYQIDGKVYGSYKDTFNINIPDESSYFSFPMFLDSLILTKDETFTECQFSPELIIGSDTLTFNYNQWINLDNNDIPEDTFIINNSKIIYNEFIIDIADTSYIYTSDLKYQPKYYGKVKYTSIDDTLTFEIPDNANDMTFFNAPFEDTIALTDQMKMYSSSCTIDFSNDKSPGVFSDSLQWKGIYFNNLGVDEIQGDSAFVFSFSKEPSTTFKGDSSSWLGYIARGKPWIDIDTIQENPNYRSYNYFKAYYDTIKINNIHDSIEWEVNGRLIVPFLAENPYGFRIPYQEGAIQLAQSYDSIFDIFPLYELEIRDFAFILIEETIDTIYGEINHENREINVDLIDGTQGSDNSFKVYPLFDISAHDLLIDGEAMNSGSPDSYIMFYGLLSKTVELALVSYDESIVIYDLNVERTEAVGYNDINQNASINISPNPVSDYVELSGLKPGSLIRIFDSNGEVVWSEKAKKESELIITDKLRSGTYFIHISFNSDYCTKKIIKI